jgi:dolichol-phosphate mannosyltransferase
VIHVVVPAFNEAESIEGALAGIAARLLPFAVPFRVVVVDDGSSDGTAERCQRVASKELPVEVVSHPRNLGPGAAFLSGFLRVLEDADPLDVVLTFEADQTSDPRILSRLLHRIWEEGDEIVLASCYLYGGGIRGTGWYRYLLSHLANGLMKKTLGLSGLSTLSSFYRAYQVSALRKLQERYGDGFITSRGFECMVEVLHRAACLRMRISEVPMVLDWTKRRGRSKMRILRTSLGYLGLAARALLGRP